MGIGQPPWLGAGLPHVWLPYTQMKTADSPLPVVGAKGARLILADGRELVDGTASWWCTAHGYGHPHIVEAVIRQAERLPHVMFAGLANEPAYRLAYRLTDKLPGDLSRVFFSESGSVSVEIAMKIAIQHFLNKGERRTKFVSFLGGYHGDTTGAMSVCDPEEGMHRLFRGALLKQHVLPLPCSPDEQNAFAFFLYEHRNEIAAIVVEPLVQGAGGMRFHDKAVLEFLRRQSRTNGILLIFDEIFVGFGRLGQSLFACEIAGVVPDIVTFSKALSGGTVPLAATVTTEDVFQAFWHDDPELAFMHGPTYMGNAIACAAANASLDLFETEPRLAQALAIEQAMMTHLMPLQHLPGVVDVRCRGALAVVRLAPSVALTGMSRRFVEAGVWIRPFRDVVYVAPPLVIDRAEQDRLAEAMIEVVTEAAGRNFQGNKTPPNEWQ